MGDNNWLLAGTLFRNVLCFLLDLMLWQVGMSRVARTVGVTRPVWVKRALARVAPGRGLYEIAGAFGISTWRMDSHLTR